jgi:hypothetical protein
MAQISSSFHGLLKRNITHIFSIATIALFGAIFVIYPSVVYAEIIFDQSPQDESLNGPILNTFQLVSFTCTSVLTCNDSAGKTVYNIGVWLKKVGNPEDIQLSVVSSWRYVASATSSASNAVLASTIPNDSYKLVWFYFPQGIVIENKFAINQYFQLNFANTVGTYNTENYYRALYNSTNDYSALQQWCRVDRGCSSSIFFFKLDDGQKDLSKETFGYSNVLFLPGLQASRLYKPQGVTCDINCEDQLWESNNKADIEDLYLNTDGTTKNSHIYTRDAISETNTPFYTGMAGQNIYKSFFATLDSLSDPSLPQDHRMAHWQTYAYDWRQSVGDIVENGTPYEYEKKSLISTLEALVASSTTGKVTIIAHSNGGLLAKALMVKLQKMKNDGTSNLIDKIDNLILVATPQIGTASAVPALLHGYDQRILLGYLLDEEHARELGRNMLGGYGLLPSKEYINRVNISPVTFRDNAIPSGVTTNLINAYGDIIDSYGEYKKFLTGDEGRSDPEIYQTKLPIKLSESLITHVERVHDDIDMWVPPETMRVIEVAGWGLDTVASFEYYPKLTGCTGGTVGCANPYTLDERPIFTVDGDKTVVEPSAHYMDSEKWWVNFKNYNTLTRVNREHKNILEVKSVNDLIKSIIQKTNILPDNVLTSEKPLDVSNRLRISIHSPVSIGSYDALGNFTGKVCKSINDFCYIQEDIPNSSYMEFGEGKYINLPEENLQKVVLQGTDIGTFTFEFEKVLPGGVGTKYAFVDIPVTTQTKGEVMVDQLSQTPQLNLDINSDGLMDFIVKPGAGFDPILFLQIMRKNVEISQIPNQYKYNLYARIDDIIRSIQKGKLSKAELSAERFKRVLDRSIVKKGYKKISDSDADVLVMMLENLLINLRK